MRESEDFERFLLLLGRMNYSWTNTESLLIHFIAGLVGCDKEKAVVVFLTLNTTRARIDLVERLAKLERTPEAERERVLALTAEFLRLATLRNRYNHCIYAFDSSSGGVRSIMMRISDRKDRIKLGRNDEIDDAAAGEIETSLARLADLNRRMWRAARELDYPL
jgi:hypothetical protein